MATMNTNPTSSKTWPREMRALDWPVGGVSYTYQHRGYVRPEKLAYWLQQTFGHDETNHRVFSGYIYVKAPRQPNEEELEWISDRDRDTSVFVKELGRELRLPPRPQNRSSVAR